MDVKYISAKFTSEDCSNILSDQDNDVDNAEKDNSCAESENKEGKESQYLSPDDNGEKYVIDGEHYLRRLVWYNESLFREIIQKFLNYIGSRYSKYTAVFDSYQDGPSSKNNQHLRRTMKSKVSSSVSINFDYSIGNVIQREFLCNNNYKECLIRVLVHVLSCDGHSIVERHGKADTLIVSTVLDFACLGMDICLIAATTDSRYL